MSRRLPGRGCATQIRTQDGNRYFFSSQRRGFMATAEGGMRWFKPSRLSGVKIGTALATPFARTPSYAQGSMDVSNLEWEIADHISADRFEGAEITHYRETEGEIGATLFTGYVSQRGGVQADGTKASFSYTSTLGAFLPNATIGGRVFLDRDTFPNLAPAPVVAVTLVATGSAGSDEIVRVGIATNHGFALALPYAGPWPVGPQRISGLTAGSTTFTVVGRDVANSIIFAGQTTFTVPSYGAVQLWVNPEDVEGEAPAEVSNPNEGAAIPVLLGQYMGASGATDEDGNPEAQVFCPAYVYDWMQSNAALCKYVYEDLFDPLTEGALRTSTAGNNDVIIIDTAPPTEDSNGEPIDNPWTYTDDRTSIKRGQFRYLRKDGVDVLGGGLITWHAPGGPGSVFGTFDLNVTVLTAWMREVFNKPDFTFDPSRFHILTQAAGAKVTDATVQAAVPGMNAYRFAGLVARLLVNHAKIPAAKLDLDSLRSMDALALPKMRRFLTSPEQVGTIYAAACQEAGVLSYETTAGLVAWKKTSITAPPPAVFRFDEARTAAGSVSYATNDWGPYFNAASGITDQGLPYDLAAGKITVGEIVNEDALAANRGVKVGAPGGPIAFLMAYDKAEMRASIREQLAVQGLPSDTYHARVYALDVGTGAALCDVDAADALVAGDTLSCGYIASRVDAEMRRLLPKGTNALVVGLDKNPDDDSIDVTFWKMGGTTANKGQALWYDPALHTNPSSLGGGAAPSAWDRTKSDAWKAYWTNASGSGVGGWWAAEDDGHIDAADTSGYSYSVQRGS